jgi:NADPH:quinone reductase
MQAVRIHKFGGADALVVEEVEKPQPKEGEVLIKVAAVGVNYGEILQRQGTYPIPVELPTILGSEVAGTVAALGAGVAEPPVGTRVLALTTNGAYAEYATANIERVVPLPPTLDFAPATALFAQGLTAFLMLTETANLQPGQTVLVNSAAGGVGSLLVQLAKLRGASMVIGTAGSTSKLDFIRELGADVAINYTDLDWAQQVRAATGGTGVNLAFDAVGGEIGAQTLSAIAPFGQLVVYGAASGSPTPYTAVQLSFTNLTLRGFAIYGYSPQKLEQGLGELLNYTLSGKLALKVGASFPLAEVKAAHQALEGRATVGKVVLTV